MMARSRAVDRVRSQTAARSAVERLGYRDEARPGDRTTARATRWCAATRRAACSARWRTCRPAQRDAVLLAFGKGLSAAEIAEASGVPLGTAKSRLRLGLEKARESRSAA